MTKSPIKTDCFYSNGCCAMTVRSKKYIFYEIRVLSSSISTIQLLKLSCANIVDMAIKLTVKLWRESPYGTKTTVRKDRGVSIDLFRQLMMIYRGSNGVETAVNLRLVESLRWLKLPCVLQRRPRQSKYCSKYCFINELIQINQFSKDYSSYYSSYY